MVVGRYKKEKSSDVSLPSLISASFNAKILMSLVRSELQTLRNSF